MISTNHVHQSKQYCGTLEQPFERFLADLVLVRISRFHVSFVDRVECSTFPVVFTGECLRQPAVLFLGERTQDF